MFARSSTDPQVLASLANISSVRVFREIAANRHTDQATVEVLWRAAVRLADPELLGLLFGRVEPGTVTEVFAGSLLERDRLFPTYVARSSVSAAPWHDYAPNFAAGSAAFRVLREASDELRASAVPPLLESGHVRAALEAAAMCAAGVVPGVSAVDAFNRFVDARPGVLKDPEGDERSVPAAAACLRHMALCADVTIGADLAELLCAHAGVLVNKAPFISQTCYTVPLFGARVTSEAFEVFRRCSSAAAEARYAAMHGSDAARGAAALVDASWLSLPAAEFEQELDAGNIAAEPLSRLLYAAPQRFSSRSLNQALRICHRAGLLPDILSGLDPSVIVDEDLLVGMASEAYRLIPFLAGEMPVKPTPRIVELLFADNDAGLALSKYSATGFGLRRSIAARFRDWNGQPWADVLVGALGPAMFNVDGPAADVVVETLHDAFGTDTELWGFAFDLLDLDFPGSLTDLLSMVRSLASATTPATAT